MERIIFLIGFFSSGITASTDPPANIGVKCLQKFVPEGGRVDCDCKTDNDDAVWSSFLSWPGYSNNSKLNVGNVTHADNGKVFTCLLTWGGHKLTTNYTLHVAYGPDDKHTRIDGPVSFITDGTKILRLKCVATEVYPPPRFDWEGGVKCLNDEWDQGFCDIKPQPPWDDGQYVYCSVISNYNNVTVNTTYKLNLTYPPGRNPEILGYTSGQVLRNGDELHCRVSGGKPIVKKVNFSCSSEIPHQDQEDITDGSSVQSSVTIDINNTTNLSMVCVCSAIWEPSEDLYRKISSATVFVNNDVQDEETYFDKIRIKIAVAVTAALLIAITIGIVASILVKKKRTHEGSRGGNAQNETANGNEGERTSKKSDSSTSSPGQAAGNGSKSGGSTPRSSSSGSDKPSTNPNYTSTALQEVEIHPYMDLHTRDPTYASTTSSKDPHMYMELKTLKALQPGSEKNGNDGYETPQVPGQANKSSDGYETPQPPREGRRRSATYANQGVPADPIQEEVNYYNEA